MRFRMIFFHVFSNYNNQSSNDQQFCSQFIHNERHIGFHIPKKICSLLFEAASNILTLRSFSITIHQPVCSDQIKNNKNLLSLPIFFIDSQGE